MARIVRNLVKAAWRTLVPKSARNSLRLWLLLDTPDFAPRLIDDFSAGPVVVLAPHSDDEVIGPGGAVIKHLRAGVKATFVILTDGMAGDPSAPGGAAETRKNESRRAADILGVTDLLFLDGPDGALSDAPPLVAAVEKILLERRPAIIYAPAMTDHHNDHWGANRILRKVLDRLPGELAAKLVIRGYEVWTPLPANRMCDISDVVETKRQCIDVFASQTKLIDYARTILGLNQYRSMVNLCGKGYAEAFLETTAEEYRWLFDQINLRRPADAAPRRSPAPPQKPA
jgi:LmbE family N-acetylglucosaminyl deacetylase